MRRIEQAERLGEEQVVGQCRGRGSAGPPARRRSRRRRSAAARCAARLAGPERERDRVRRARQQHVRPASVPIGHEGDERAPGIAAAAPAEADDRADRGGGDRRQVGRQDEHRRRAVGDRPAGRRPEPSLRPRPVCRIGVAPAALASAQDRRVGTDHDHGCERVDALRPPGPTDRAGRGRAPGAPRRRATRRGATSRPRAGGPARRRPAATGRHPDDDRSCSPS